MIESQTVTKALFAANTPEKKMAANKLLDEYIEQQKQKGLTERGIRCAFKAHVTRLRKKQATKLLGEEPNLYQTKHERFC